MNEIKIIDELLEQLKSGITDIQICEEDLKNSLTDFNCRYSKIYVEKNSSRITEKIIQELKFDFIQFRRRTYIRTAFANIEGIVFAIKTKILHYGKNKPGLKNNNKLNLNQRRLKMIDRIELMFDTYSELRGIKIIDNWKKYQKENFKAAIKIRNRITHPNYSKDLIINREDLRCVKKAHEIFFQYLNELEKDEI